MGTHLAVDGGGRRSLRALGRGVAGRTGRRAADRVGLWTLPARHQRQRRLRQRPVSGYLLDREGRSTAWRPIERRLAGVRRQPRRARTRRRIVRDRWLRRQRQRGPVHPRQDDRGEGTTAPTPFDQRDRVDAGVGSPLRGGSRGQGDLPIRERPLAEQRDDGLSDLPGRGHRRLAPGPRRPVRPGQQRRPPAGGHGGDRTPAQPRRILLGRTAPHEGQRGRPGTASSRGAPPTAGGQRLHLRHPPAGHGAPAGARGHPAAGGRVGRVRRLRAARPPGAHRAGAGTDARPIGDAVRRPASNGADDGADSAGVRPRGRHGRRGRRRPGRRRCVRPVAAGAGGTGARRRPGPRLSTRHDRGAGWGAGAPGPVADDARLAGLAGRPSGARGRQHEAVADRTGGRVLRVAAAGGPRHQLRARRSPGRPADGGALEPRGLHYRRRRRRGGRDFREQPQRPGQPSAALRVELGRPRPERGGLRQLPPSGRQRRHAGRRRGRARPR